MLLTGLSNLISPYIIDTFDVLIRTPNLGKACISSYSEDALSTVRLPFTHRPIQILLEKMWTQFDLNLDYEPLKVEQPPKISLIELAPGTEMLSSYDSYSIYTYCLDVVNLVTICPEYKNPFSVLIYNNKFASNGSLESCSPN